MGRGFGKGVKMRALGAAAMLLAGAVAAGAVPFGDDLYESSVTIHSTCMGIQGFIVASLGAAMGYSAAYLPLLQPGIKSDDIASISGVYNGNSSWRVVITSMNDFHMVPDVQNNKGFRYSLRLSGASSESDMEDAVVGYVLDSNVDPDPTNDAIWTNHYGHGGHLVVNGEARVAEYQALLNLEVYGGQQFAYDGYSDLITVTFMDGGY